MNTYKKEFILILASTLFISCGNNNNKVTGLDRIIAYAEGKGETPTLEDYSEAGVIGLTENRLTDMNEIISNLNTEEVDSTEEVQALADALGIEIILPTPTAVVSNPKAKVLTKKVAITGYLKTCDDYIEKKGKDTNFNGVLDDTEITSTTEVHPQGLALTISELESKIANGEDVSTVNTCNITSMQFLFLNNTTFNQNIGAWNTSAVSNMEGVFTFASAFNQDIGEWDTSSVTNMNSMFAFSSNFNQNIRAWNVNKVEDHTSFSFGSALAPDNSPF